MSKTKTKPAAPTRDLPAVVEPLAASSTPPADIAAFDPQTFESMQRVALAIGSADFCPDHLKGDTEAKTIANCLRVVNQAYRWNIDPWGAADESYVVRGKLAWQGKLVIAVVNARANLAGRLRFEYTGTGAGRECTVVGRFRNEADERRSTLTLAQGRTDNKMWVSDPDQKLAYSAAAKWARLHCPEIMLGVLTIDELDRVDADRVDETKPAGVEAVKSRLLADAKKHAEAKAVATADEPPMPKPPEAPAGRLFDGAGGGQGS